MRDVLRFARLAHPEALDRLGEDHRRLALVVNRHVKCRVDLVRVEAAAVEVPYFLVGPVGDEGLELRRVEEMLADEGAVLALEGLVLAVDAFHHSPHQDALLVAGEQRVPAGAPDDLDDIPAGAAEVAFQFLDDLAVAADGTVETLQVAVDDEDQVVEVLAPGHADGAHRLGFVHLAVAAEAPHLAALGLREAAVLKIFHEPRLVDRHQRSKAHRNGRELPEVRHQPRMRIRRDALAIDLLPEIVHLLRREAAKHERSRIDARCRVALDEHEVAAVGVRRRVPEMVVADVVQRRCRREARDMAADVGVPVRPHDHRHRVPADVVADPLLDRLIAGKLDLLVDRDRVDVRGVRREGQVGAGAARLVDQRLDQEMRALRALVGEHAVERVEPFPSFQGVVIGIGGHRRISCGRRRCGREGPVRWEFDCMRRYVRPHRGGGGSRSAVRADVSAKWK